jgi:NAD(P)-dependent dehydrogenase (short-subunit alcohol dehydrogenase family)
MVEEIAEAEIRAQLETKVLGALWVTQAALRTQGTGDVPQASSIGGVSAFMNTGAYHASKWALESFSQSLSLEVAGFGVKVTLVQPTGYSTDRAGSSAKHATAPPAYDPVRELASPSGSSPPSSGTARS